MSSASTDMKKRCQYCLEYLKIHITCCKCDAAYHVYCWKKVPGAYVNKRGQLFCCCTLTSNYGTTDTNLRIQDNPPERVIKKENVDGYNRDMENCPIKQEDSEWNEFKCGACHLEFTNKEYLENHYSKCPNKEGEFIQEFIKEDKDLENWLHKEEHLEWSELPCDSCLLEFTNKEHLKNHYSDCPNKEGKFIEVLKEHTDLEYHLLEEDNSEANEEHVKNHCSQTPNKQGESVPDLNKDKAGLPYSFSNEENFEKESCEQYLKQCYVESSYSQLNKDNSVCITNTQTNRAHVYDKQKRYKCTVCNCSTHVKECAGKCIHIQSNERSLKCDMCDYKAKESETLKSHLSSKHYDRREEYNSRLCSFSTLSEDTFGSLQWIYTSESLFKCNWCDYTAAQQINLKIHIQSKHSNVDKKYKCGDCEYSSNTKGNLVTHRRTHTNEKPFKCDMCDYAAAQKQHLKMHFLTKHYNADKEYKCRRCEYSSCRKDILISHMHTHTNQKQFKCDMCDYAVAHKQHLKTHFLTKHSNADKKYKCGSCEYSSHRKDSLVSHVHTHTNEKRFKCDMCDYAATQKRCLKGHVLAKHSSADKEKEYKCKDCQYITYRRANLASHIYAHTNQRPFKCDKCDYAAAKKRSLKAHVLAKHSNVDKEYKCKD